MNKYYFLFLLSLFSFSKTFIKSAPFIFKGALTEIDMQSKLMEDRLKDEIINLIFNDLLEKELNKLNLENNSEELTQILQKKITILRKINNGYLGGIKTKTKKLIASNIKKLIHTENQHLFKKNIETLCRVLAEFRLLPSTEKFIIERILEPEASSISSNQSVESTWSLDSDE